MKAIRALSGQTKTPVVEIDGTAVAGSAAIVAALDARFPDRPLIPADPATRAAALKIQARFDDDFGPRLRRAVLAAFLDAGFYLPRCFSEGQPWPKRALYIAAFPMTRGLVRKGNGITGPDAVADGHVAVAAALDIVAETSAATGYLAGDAFSVADLAAASHMAAVIDPPNSPMARPAPLPAPVAALVSRYAAHPGAAWVRAIYARHRRDG
jgi:glutathione S-transferase